jgi:hypothetical protein
MFKRVIYEDAQGRTLSARVPMHKGAGKVQYFATVYNQQGQATHIEITGAKSPEDAFALVDGVVQAYLTEQRMRDRAQNQAVDEVRKQIELRADAIFNAMVKRQKDAEAWSDGELERQAKKIDPEVDTSKPGWATGNAKLESLAETFAAARRRMLAESHQPDAIGVTDQQENDDGESQETGDQGGAEEDRRAEGTDTAEGAGTDAGGGEPVASNVIPGPGSIEA